MTFGSIAMIGLMLALASCSLDPPEIGAAKSAVRARLVDPDSAKFDALRINAASGAVCGLVNGKNRMGGYSGSTAFFFTKDGAVTFVRESPTDSDFESYFRNIKYAKSTEWSELEDRCWQGKKYESACGSNAYTSDNDYCRMIFEGKSSFQIFVKMKDRIDR